MNNINPNPVLPPQANLIPAAAPQPRPTVEAVTQLAESVAAQAQAFLPMIYIPPFGPPFQFAAQQVARQAMADLRQVFLNPGENLDHFAMKLRLCDESIRPHAKQVVKLALSLDNNLFEGYSAASELLDDGDRLVIQTPQGNFGVTKTYAERVMLYRVTGDQSLLSRPYPHNAGPVVQNVNPAGNQPQQPAPGNP